MKPLDGIKVLDLSRILAGPYCSMLLADMGAEVIKVERPVQGDDSRAFGPPFVEKESTYFMSVNRNKKSITLNFKNPRALEIVKKLIQNSDVLIENFRPGYMESIGLGFDEVHKLNSKLIYASISGFGHTGPMASNPGYDLAVQGMSGIMDITGSPDGPPFKVGTSIADILAGIYANQGILLALISRGKTGKGQKIDVALLDGMVSLLTYQAGSFFATGKAPSRKGNQHPSICPYETFRTRDGWLNLAVGNDKLWLEFCDLLELQNEKENSKFATNGERVKNRSELLKILEPIFEKKSTEDWGKLFDEKGIPWGPILTLDKVLTHPQVLAREMVQELVHVKGFKVKVTGIPVKLSSTPGKIETAPPSIGQHTEEILSKELKLSKEEIEKLRKEDVL
ncbi:MAG: CoA transferase [Candidatus Diapherotrites archaeon]|nr:CoA transferase [Candidatus Diapherotrites archaeon]